jgi:hypothetical protein
VGQELGDVEADAAGTDDRHAFAGDAIAFDQVGVGDHLLVLDARQLGPPRHDAGGENDVLETGIGQFRRCAISAQFERHAGVVAGGDRSSAAFR